MEATKLNDPPAGPVYGLFLADGGSLALSAFDGQASRIIDFWAEKSDLKPMDQEDRGLLGPARHRILAVTGELRETPRTARLGLVPPPSLRLESGDLLCLLEPPGAPRLARRFDLLRDGCFAAAPASEPLSEETWFWRQLMRISSSIGRMVQKRGGALLHSGLAACAGDRGSPPSGFLLAGRSGVGKSTAGRRLSPPWISLADDIALIVRPVPGEYRAHPFPTWSRFFGLEAGDGSDVWNVQRDVPLRAIFVLEQGEDDRIEPLGPGQALSLLLELADQASGRLTQDFSMDDLTAFNLERFENLCALVKAIPAYLLYVRLNGTFWNEIQRVL